MTKSYIVDAGALVLYLNHDPRITDAITSIASGKAFGYVAEVNAAEFYHKTCRTFGRQAADARYSVLREGGLRFSGGADLAQMAGLEKCRSRLDLSLADCFALALARERRGILLTTDSELGKVRDVEVMHLPV